MEWRSARHVRAGFSVDNEAKAKWSPEPGCWMSLAMTGEIDKGPSRRAGPLLAAAIVLFLGAFGAAAIIAGGGGDPLLVLLTFGGGLAAIVCFGWLLGRAGSASTAVYRWVFSREARPAYDYSPKPRSAQCKQFGTNRPPTANEVRELKEGLRNWVPSNTPNRRNSVRDSDTHRR